MKFELTINCELCGPWPDSVYTKYSWHSTDYTSPCSYGADILFSNKVAVLNQLKMSTFAKENLNLQFIK